MQNIRQRLTNAYMKGFREAVAGVPLPVKTNANARSAYLSGYADGTVAIRKAQIKAEHLAKNETANH